MDYFEGEKTDDQLDEGGLVPIGEHIMQLEGIEDGTATSTGDGAEYGYWRLKFVVKGGGEADGMKMTQFMSFDRPDNLAEFIQLRRRQILRALGHNPQAGQRNRLDKEAFIGRYVKVTIGHWENKKRGKTEPEFKEIEAYVSQQQLPSAQPQQQAPPPQQQAVAPQQAAPVQAPPPQQAMTPTAAQATGPVLPVEPGPPPTTPVDEIPF